MHNNVPYAAEPGFRSNLGRRGAEAEERAKPGEEEGNPPTDIYGYNPEPANNNDQYGYEDHGGNH